MKRLDDDDDSFLRNYHNILTVLTMLRAYMNYRGLILVTVIIAEFASGYTGSRHILKSQSFNDVCCSSSKNIIEITPTFGTSRCTSMKMSEKFVETVDKRKNNTSSQSSTIGYGCVALAYFIQIFLSFKKNHWQPKISLSETGAPGIACAISFILSASKIKYDRGKDDVPSFLMNGTLMIYSSLCMLQFSLAAQQITTSFTKFFLGTAIFSFLLNAKEYSSIYKEGFIRGNEHLIPRIHKANLYALPKDLPNMIYFVGMLIVILLKVNLFIPILSASRNAGISLASRGSIVSKVSSLANLSILGGSLVTIRDAANQKYLSQKRFLVLNFFINLLFCSLVGKFIIVFLLSYLSIHRFLNIKIKQQHISKVKRL